MRDLPMSLEVSERIIEELEKAGVQFFTVLPCEKVRRLYDLIPKHFRHISLAREEEGVGICAGASLANVKTAMLVQSSGIGNMINAMCSLTKTYQMPLLLIVSWRGVYREKILAQIPMGEKLPDVLRAIGVSYNVVKAKEDVHNIGDVALKVYENKTIHAVLLNPSIWGDEKDEVEVRNNRVEGKGALSKKEMRSWQLDRILTRMEILKAITPYLNGKIIVCNLGIPCKELYYVNHQRSNFYMLGSMGLASSIGLGISTFTSKEVVAIEGDGSLLTNLGTLSTIAMAKPKNLTILAIDNGVHGSTGNQPTATSYCVDLELVAKGLGIEKTSKVANRGEILSALDGLRSGPNFVHILALPGNADVPDVPLTPIEIKRNVMESLRE
jgi:sulfopyruvate decarboxylase subunit beta